MQVNELSRFGPATCECYRPPRESGKPPVRGDGGTPPEDGSERIVAAKDGSQRSTQRTWRNTMKLTIKRVAAAVMVAALAGCSGTASPTAASFAQQDGPLLSSHGGGVTFSYTQSYDT